MIRFLLTVLTIWSDDRSFQMKCVFAPPSVGTVLASVMLGGGGIQKGREPMNRKPNILAAFLVPALELAMTACGAGAQNKSYK